MKNRMGFAQKIVVFIFVLDQVYMYFEAYIYVYTRMYNKIVIRLLQLIAENVENRNSSSNQEPKQALNSIFKILNA